MDTNTADASEVSATVPTQVEAKGAKRSIPVWSLVVAAIAIIVGCIVVGLLVAENSPVSAQQGPNLLPNPGFEEGLGDWEYTNGYRQSLPVQSIHLTNVFSAIVDTSTVHSGVASELLKSPTSATSTFGQLITFVAVDGLKSKRVRFSGYVKTEGANVGATLNMSVIGTYTLNPAVGVGAEATVTHTTAIEQDTMGDRPILGTTDWTKYDLVLDVPDNATQIILFMTAVGSGKVWLDDVSLSQVGSDVATTSDFQRTAPTNLDFEAGLAGWQRDIHRLPDYEVGTDTATVHSGAASGLIRSISLSPSNFVLYQTLNTQNYKGQRIRLSAYLKTENAQSDAWLELKAEDETGVSLARSAAGPKDTTGWQRYEAEVDVPVESSYLNLSITLNGSGTVWIDDVQLEGIGKIKPLTATPTP